MSMVGIFIRVTGDELQEYINDSSLFEERIDDEANDHDPGICDINKAWDALSFLLTGYGPAELEKANTPLSWTIFGAHTLDEKQDLGYGPANYLTVEEVKEVNNALLNISSLQLKNNYNSQKMNELGIYPNNWEKIEDEIKYLSRHFEDLKEFYSKAAANSHAVITYIS